MMMALPVFALLMVAEATVTTLRGHNVYALKDFGGSMSQLGINILVRLAIGGALIGLHFWLYQFRVFEVTAGPWGWLLTFVTIDFVFYGYHRAQHRVRFLWCAHVVHHSSEYMNLGTALRQSPTGPFTKALFYWPLPLLGFDPLVVASAGAIATLYGFWTHTEVVKKLWAPLEWLFVTAFASPCTPWLESRVRRQELRQFFDYLGPAIRHFRARDGARAVWPAHQY
jgi:sterol desaturase/sphingolipid hydroxylase (fatty acid hydroxylase superfamily)